MNLFGKKKAAPPPVQDPAVVIGNIRANVDLLDKREQHLNKRIDQAKLQAKQKAGKKDKNGRASTGCGSCAHWTFISV